MTQPTAQQFETFVLTVEPRLRRALAGCRPIALVPEGVAAALAWSWENWAELEEMANPVGYLFRVAQSATRDRPGLALRWPPPADIGVPDIEPGLIPALLRLPERQRIAVWLVHGLGWTHGEVGEALDITASSVSTHVTRGMEALRSAMKVDSHA